MNLSKYSLAVAFEPVSGHEISDGKLSQMTQQECNKCWVTKIGSSSYIVYPDDYQTTCFVWCCQTETNHPSYLNDYALPEVACVEFAAMKRFCPSATVLESIAMVGALPSFGPDLSDWLSSIHMLDDSMDAYYFRYALHCAYKQGYRINENVRILPINLITGEDFLVGERKADMVVLCNVLDSHVSNVSVLGESDYIRSSPHHNYQNWAKKLQAADPKLIFSCGTVAFLRCWDIYHSSQQGINENYTLLDLGYQESTGGDVELLIRRSGKGR